MADAIVVLNAGSSSLKFSLFVDGQRDLELDVRGQIEGLFTAPRFAVWDRGGEAHQDVSWDEGSTLGHDGALDHLVPFLQRRLAGRRLAGVGHRVVHGGLEYMQPVRVEPGVVAMLEKLGGST
jgi:acetate kinase